MRLSPRQPVPEETTSSSQPRNFFTREGTPKRPERALPPRGENTSPSPGDGGGIEGVESLPPFSRALRSVGGVPDKGGNNLVRRALFAKVDAGARGHSPCYVRVRGEYDITR